MPGADGEGLDLAAPQPGFARGAASTSARWTASWASTASDAMDSRSCSMPFRLLELARGHVGELAREVGDEALPGQLAVGVGLHLGLLVVGLDAGGGRLLVERLALEADLQLRVLRLRLAGLRFRVEGLQLQLGVAQLEDHGVRLHHRARVDEDPLHACLRRRPGSSARPPAPACPGRAPRAASARA